MFVQADIDFLSRVMAWPVGALSTGYINLHYFMKNKKDPTAKPFVLGKPVKTIDEFVKLANWCMSKPDITDLYFCTSLQSEFAFNKKKVAVAARLAENAMALKAIWLDLDVSSPGLEKPTKKEYLNWDELFADLQKFVTQYGLPWPNGIVCSGEETLPDGKRGGGIQVYWINNRALTRAEWTPYAEGLKAAAIEYGLLCDHTCTGDPARILRVPGTFNYKKEPKRPTRVVALDADLDFGLTLQPLLKIAPVTVAVTAGPSVTMFDPALFPKRNAVVESLSQGLEREEIKVSVKSVAQACPFMKDTLMTGGANNAQPLWMLTSLMSTFMEDGEKVVHLLSDGHAGYTQESTDEMYQRKLAEKAKQGLGYPSCKTIQGWGAPQCATCPLFVKGKSPLNFGTPTTTQVVVSSGNVAAAGQVTPVLPQGLFGAGGPLPPPQRGNGLMLPDNYLTDKAGRICYFVRGQGEEPDQEIPLFKTILSDPWVQDKPPALNFTTTLDLGNTGTVSVKRKDMATVNDLVRSLYDQGALTEGDDKSVKDFIVSWMNKINEAQKAIASLPFGWLFYPSNNGKIADGFVYGGTAYHSNGTTHDSGFGGAAIRDMYNPKGEKQAWLDACALVNSQKRPELDAIIAAAFGAPLMHVPGQYSTVIGCWGESGTTKSSAVKVALAVWGHPKKTKEVTKTTAKSIIDKMGETKNLPLYWDEIRDDLALKNVYETLFSSAEGVSYGKLTSKGEQVEKKDWQLLAYVCSNESVIDYIVKNYRSAAPGLRRMFEYKIEKLPNQVGMISDGDATNMLNLLERNYGIVGMEYAKFLGQNPQLVWDQTKVIERTFETTLSMTNTERYWKSAMTCLYAGAEYANMFGANIDLPVFYQWLCDELERSRERFKEEAVEVSSGEKAQSEITEFLNIHKLNQVFTDKAPTIGRQTTVRVIKAPPLDRGAPIFIHWAVIDRMLLISRKHFLEWMGKKENLSTRPIMEGLKSSYNAYVKKATLAGGTVYRVGQEPLIHIPVPAGSDLEELMHAFESKQDTGAPAAAQASGALQTAMQQAQQDVDTARKHNS